MYFIGTRSREILFTWFCEWCSAFVSHACRTSVSGSALQFKSWNAGHPPPPTPLAIFSRKLSLVFEFPERILYVFAYKFCIHLTYSHGILNLFLISLLYCTRSLLIFVVITGKSDQQWLNHWTRVEYTKGVPCLQRVGPFNSQCNITLCKSQTFEDLEDRSILARLATRSIEQLDGDAVSSTRISGNALSAEGTTRARAGTYSGAPLTNNPFENGGDASSDAIPRIASVASVGLEMGHKTNVIEHYIKCISHLEHIIFMDRLRQVCSKY